MSRDATIRIGTDAAHLNRSLAAARGSFRKWAGGVARDVGRSLRGAISNLTPIGALAGGAGVALMVKEVFDLDKRLTRLGINAEKTRGDMLALNNELQKVSVNRGIDQGELLSGAEKYAELTGRLDEFTAHLDEFGMIATATGGKMEDIASAAAALSNNLKLDPGQFLAVFDVLAKQGKLGAVEMANLSSLLAELTPQFARFNGEGMAGAAKLGAFLQILRTGAGSAASAATQLEALMSAVQQNRKKLEDSGVEIYSDKEKTKLRDLSDILVDIQAKIPEKDLVEIFGRQEARAAILTFLKEGKERFDELAATADKQGTIARDFGTMAASSSFKWASALAQVKKVAAEIVLPHVGDIASAFTTMAKAVAWMAEHKAAMLAIFAAYKGLGAIPNLPQIGGGGGGFGGGGGGSGVGGGGGGGGGGGKLGAFANGLAAAQALIGVAGAAYAVGTAFDELTGASDWLSDLFRKGDPGGVNIDTGDMTPMDAAIAQAEGRAKAYNDPKFLEDAKRLRKLRDMGITDPNAQLPTVPAPQKVEVVSTVKVNAGPGIQAEVERDPKRRRKP